MDQEKEPESSPTVRPPEARTGLRGTARMRRRLRSLHDQTWELELVISGAVAVLLAFVPGKADELYYPLSAQLTGSAASISFLGFYYVKLILYTLIIAFGFHIAVRAFWVALVGLDSVFPRGIRWHRLRQGPFTRDVFRRTLPSVRELIMISDGVASVTFASAFSLVAVFVISVVGAVGLGGIGFAVTAVLPLPFDRAKTVAWAAATVATLITLPFLVDLLVGRFVHRKEGRQSWAGRLIESSVRGASRASLFRVYGPIQLTLSSQLGRYRYGVGIFALITTVLGVFYINDHMLASGQIEYVPSAWEPVRIGGSGVDPRHYEDQTNPDRMYHLIPTIPTDVFNEETPWLRLFLPSDARRDEDALERACAGVEALVEPGVHAVSQRGVAATESERARHEAVLDCAARFWEVSVDGVRIDQRPVFFQQAGSRLRGIAWYIDLRRLPAGQHMLEVARPSRWDDPAEADEDQLPWVYRIPFWN